MAKKVMAVVKLQCPAGKATPAPPVGPALGQYGINIMEFVKTYNERTAPQAGTIIPVEITIHIGSRLPNPSQIPNPQSRIPSGTWGKS